MTYTPSQGYHFKKWKAKQELIVAAKCNTPCRDNDDKYYGIQHGLKKHFEPHVDISATYLWSQDDANAQATKTWFEMGIFPIDGRASTYGFLAQLKAFSCAIPVTLLLLLVVVAVALALM